MMAARKYRGVARVLRQNLSALSPVVGMALILCFFENLHITEQSYLHWFINEKEIIVHKLISKEILNIKGDLL